MARPPRNTPDATEGPRAHAAVVARLRERAARYRATVPADAEPTRPGAHFHSPWPALLEAAERGEPITLHGYTLTGIADVIDPAARYTVDANGSVRPARLAR